MLSVQLSLKTLKCVTSHNKGLTLDLRNASSFSSITLKPHQKLFYWRVGT